MKSVLKSLSVIVLILISYPIFCQYVQDGNKLIGSGYSGYPNQGFSLATSYVGNTIVVGGIGDNEGQGAIWVFANQSGTWVQQGNKLVGTGDAYNNGNQGSSLAISGDGNTIAFGGMRDSSFLGAVWIFIKVGENWVQQGEKLVGNNSDNTFSGAKQGVSVSLSYDGNTVVFGGADDAGGLGAVWAFERIGDVWVQSGSKIVPTDAVGLSHVGHSVDISSNGLTMVIGGYGDNGSEGAIWVFQKNGSDWVQEGNKLVASDDVGIPELGTSVAISQDGTTIVAGGSSDNGFYGASWIFTNSSGEWDQQGPKLVGTGADNTQHFALQGKNVDISADGNTVIVGAPDDDNLNGALWIFTRTDTQWSQLNSKFYGEGAISWNCKHGGSVAISGNAKTIVEGALFEDGDIGAVWVFKDSTITNIDIAESKDFKFYPNPTENIINIDLSNEDFTNAEITIQDLTTKRIKTCIINNNIDRYILDLSGFDKGVYFVKFSSANREIVKKIIKL